MDHKSNSRLRALAVLAIAGALASGCASTPLHSEASISGIRAAEAVGAADVPGASQYLQYAKEGLSRAKGLAERGQSEEAESMLLRVEADAQLAALLSREDAVKMEAQDAINQVRLLRQGKR